MATMTNREFLNGVVNANVNDELTAFAKAELAKLDARNAARKAKPTKTQVANEGLKARLMEVAEVGVTYTAAALAEKLGDGVTTQKVTALAKQLVEAGLMTVMDFKVGGKGRTVKGYTVPAEGAVEVEVVEG